MTEENFSFRNELFAKAVGACIQCVKNLLVKHVSDKQLKTSKKLPKDYFNEHVLEWCSKQGFIVLEIGDDFEVSWGHVIDVSNDQLFAVYLAKKTLENFENLLSTKAENGGFEFCFRRMTVDLCLKAWVERKNLTLIDAYEDGFTISWNNK